MVTEVKSAFEEEASFVMAWIDLKDTRLILEIKIEKK